jgi:hypothetical protein
MKESNQWLIPHQNLQIPKSKELKIKGSEYNLSDGKGLQLRIKPSGSKIWLLNYPRPLTKKRTNVKLGEYPDLSLASARKKRNRFRELLAEGVDPQDYEANQARLKSDANANTLKAVADKWFSIKSHEICPNGLAREHWQTTGPIRRIFKTAFSAAELPYFNPHSFRDTLTMVAHKKCRNAEELRAFSQNFGHENVMTTFANYGEVSSDRQAEIISGLGANTAPNLKSEEEIARAVMRELNSRHSIHY